MNKLFKTLIATSGIAILSLSSASFAGHKATHNVMVSDQYISGSFGTARNSSDSVQFIASLDRGSYMIVWAKSAAGKSKQCTTKNPTHISQLRALGSDSFLHVSLSGSTCTKIDVQNSSSFAPK
jgi:hypothetical protein